MQLLPQTPSTLTDAPVASSDHATLSQFVKSPILFAFLPLLIFAFPLAASTSVTLADRRHGTQTLIAGFDVTTGKVGGVVVYSYRFFVNSGA
jgi:hypothetical protein